MGFGLTVTRRVEAAPATFIGRMGTATVTWTRSNGQLTGISVQNPTTKTIQLQVGSESFSAGQGTTAIPVTPVAWIWRAHDHYGTGRIVTDCTGLAWKVTGV